MDSDTDSRPLSSLLEAFRKERVEWHLQVLQLEQRLRLAEGLLREHQAIIDSLRGTILLDRRSATSAPCMLGLQGASFLEQLD